MPDLFPLNRTKTKLLAGEYAFGVSVSDIHGVALPHVFSLMGYDSFFVDMEHSPDGFGAACDLMWGCRRSGLTPIARVPDPERFFLSRSLDAGAEGIIVPRVETVEQVDRIVSCCRYAPLGTRGAAMGGRHMDYQGVTDWEGTFKAANEQVLVSIMIETAPGLEALEALAARPGLDMLFIGPTDLSIAVGTPGKYTSPAMDAAVEKIVGIARRHRLIVGVQGMNVDLATRWMEMGARYVLLGNVIGLIRQSGLNGITRLKEFAAGTTRTSGPPPSPARSGPQPTAEQSLAKGCDWLAAQFDLSGAIPGQEEAAAYYKSPAVLALSGRPAKAAACLETIERRFLGPKGELALPPAQEQNRPFNTYDRAWVSWGALLCGRYDIAFRMADDILAFQDPATGGFWDTHAARAAQQGRQHTMTAGMAGIALLATRHVDAARRAADFARRVLESQVSPDAGVYLAMDASPGGRSQLRLQKNAMDYLDRTGLKQRPGRLGPVQVLLARLHLVTQDDSYRETAKGYTRAMLTGRDGIYLCAEAHKFIWGMTEIDRTGATPEHADYAAAAGRMVDYIIEHQQPSGDWREDSGVADPAKEQPLPRRIDTTCNVLMGLMHYCGWKAKILAFVLLAAAISGRAAAIDTGPQLFVDDFLIAAQSDLVRTLHRPVKDNGGTTPVLEVNDEFNGYHAMLHANGTILFDPTLCRYVMFARASANDLTSLPPSERRRVYRFTSRDGMNWIKGDQGRPQRIDLDLRDRRVPTADRFLDLFSCCYDASDRDRPYKGWLYIHSGDEGIYYFSSPDGLAWKRGAFVLAHGQKLSAPDREYWGPEDVSLFSYDPVDHRYLGLLKFYDGPRSDPNRVRSRAFVFLDRLDQPIDLARIGRVDLVPAKAEKNGDEPSDQYYACNAWRYGSLWLGGLKIWHGEGNYPYSAAGSAFLKLIVSRDGLHWHKVPFLNDAGQPEVFIPNGPEGGNHARNDGGYMCEFNNGPLRLGDELIYYYGSSSWGKNQPAKRRTTGGGIFRARLRPDGFVSIDAGSLTTKVLAFTGHDLFVNAVGPVAIEALDADGRGLGRETTSGDSLSRKVTFGGRSLRDCAGGSARLRFSVPPGGHLYSFTIR